MLAGDDDLFHAANFGGDDGCLAGEGFEVDDAEGLVDGGTAEYAGVGVEVDFFLGGKHFLNPDDLAVEVLTGGVDGFFHLGCDLGCVGCSGTEHDLGAGGEVLDGVDEVDDAFLPGDATDEEDEWDVGIDVVFLEGVGAVGGAVFVGVDAVVDDGNSLFGDVEEAKDVGLGLVGDGDDGVGHLDGGLFEPEGEVVASAELLAFPRAERLEGVNGEDHGKPVVEVGEDAAEVGIPGVEVDDVGVDVAGIEVEAVLQGAENGLEGLRCGVSRFVCGGSPDGGVFCGNVLIAKASHFDVA